MGSGSCSWNYSKRLNASAFDCVDFCVSAEHRTGNGIQPQMMPDAGARPWFGRNKRVYKQKPRESGAFVITDLAIHFGDAIITHMKILVAVVFTVIAAPLLLLFGIGSMSGAAATGDKTGLLITVGAAALIGVIWWIALRAPQPGSNAATRPLPWWMSALTLLLASGALMYFWYSMSPAP